MTRALELPAGDLPTRRAAALAQLAAALTLIGWTDLTFNAWRGCVKIDTECQRCYADTLSRRWGHHIWGATADRLIAAEAYWRRPTRWNRVAEQLGVRLRVFCMSMGDLFEIHADPALNVQLDVARARVFALIEATPWLDWQLLTKRPENARAMVPAHWWSAGWPPNVWVGTSVGRQSAPRGMGGADRRVPELLALRDATGCGPRVLFLSCEPLIGDLALRPWLDLVDETGRRVGIDWVIVGGESGKGARLMHPSWAARVIADCLDTGTPVFMKQAGARLARTWGCKQQKGEDPAEWPAPFRIQQYPEMAA